MERTLRDGARDLLPYADIGVSKYRGGYDASPSLGYDTVEDVRAQPAAGHLNDVTISVDDGDTTAVRSFLEEAGIIPSGQAVMTLVEMIEYLRGSITR